MESKTKRVLAYTLAKTFTNEELAAISGGGGAGHTIESTFRATGAAGSVPIADFDVRYDF